MGTSQPPLDQSELVKYPGYLTALARFHTNRNFMRHIGEPFRLRPVEFSILVLLSSNENVAQAQLAQALGVAAPNMTALLHGLEGRGIVERQRAESDRRVQYIVLTPKGRRLLAEAVAAGRSMDKPTFSNLSRAEQGMLLELLGKMVGVARA